MDSDSDSNEKESPNVRLGFDEQRVLQIRRQRKAERRRRKIELRKLRKEVRNDEDTSSGYWPPDPLASSPFIPGLSYPSQSMNSLNSVNSPYNTSTNLSFLTNDLRFRFVSDLLKAQIYLIKPGIESTVDLNLNNRVIQLLSEHNASESGYNYAVILRISQIMDDNLFANSFYDLVPMTLKIVFNSEPVIFGDRNSRHFLSPIDLSAFVRRSNQINLSLQAFDDINIVLGVYLVRMLTMEKAMNDFKLKFNTNWRSNKCAKEAERKMFANSNGTVRVSLKCPISKQRIEVPCVGVDCTHFQCFDLKSFVKIHHQNFQWKCPICKGVMRIVVRDKVFSKILEIVSASCIEVGYFQGGSQLVELAHENPPEPEIEKFPDLSNKDRFASSIIEEIYIERI